MTLPTIVYVVPAATCVLSWWGAGSVVPKRFLEGDRVLRVATRLGAGALAWALFVLMLALAGVLDGLAVTVVTCAFALLGLLRSRPRRFRGIPVSLVAAILAIDVVGASVPPTSADALAYHLGLPELWLRHGQFVEPFWQWLGFNPDATELLYTQGLAVGGGPTASVLGAAFAVLCTVAVFALGRELGAGSGRAGVLAAALFALQGIVTWEATGAFVELGTAFFTALAGTHAVRAVRLRSPAAAVWAGVASGGAAATKYPGLFDVVLVFAALLFARRARLVAIAVSAAALASGAWYVKNALATGNPVYPFVFGGRMWTSASSSIPHDLRAAYGVGSSPLRLALLPVDLFLHGGSFDRGQYVGPLLLPLSLVGWRAADRRGAVSVWLGGAALVLAWWASSEQARFLLPALALFAAAAGAGMVSVPRPVVLAVMAVSAAAWAIPTALLERQLVPVAFGAESQPHFVQRMTGTYDALRAASRSAGGTLALAGYNGIYYASGDAVFLGPGEFASDVSRRDYLARLQRLDVTDVLAPAHGRIPALAPIRGCLVPLSTYAARFVTSRTRGTSESFPLRLFLVRCP